MPDKGTQVKRLYWDADVFLSAINANPERLPVIEAILDDCDHGDVEIHTSVFTIAEVPDAIHLATAKRRQVDEFHTYDIRGLSKFSEITGYPIVQPRTDRLPFSSRK